MACINNDWMLGSSPTAASQAGCRGCHCCSISQHLAGHTRNILKQRYSTSSIHGEEGKTAISHAVACVYKQKDKSSNARGRNKLQQQGEQTEANRVLA